MSGARRRGDPGRVLSFWGEADSSLVHQMVFGLLYGVALLLVLPEAVPIVRPGALTLGAALQGGAMLSAALASSGLGAWRRWPAGARDVLPLVSILAVLLLEASTGFVALYLVVLVFVPVGSLAWTSGVRGVLLGVAASIAVVLVPWALNPDLPTYPVLVRGVLVPLVSLALGTFIAGAAERERRRTAELEEVSERLRDARDVTVGLMDAVTEQGIVATDPQGWIEVFNPGAEKLLGLTAGDVAGRRVTELGLREELDAAASEVGLLAEPEQDREAARFRALVGSAAHGGVEVHDWTLPHNGGSPRVFRVTVTRRVPLPTESEGGYLFVATDITAHVESERAKDQFLGYVSHELRTPIGSVLGYVELIGLDDDNLDDEQRAHLAVVERNARRLLRLVDDLLLAAQVDAGRFAVTPEPTDLRDIVATALGSAAPQARAAGVGLVDDSVTSVPLPGDPTRLGQLVDNLVSNALKYTPRGGTVTVRAAAGTLDDGAPAAVLTVRDTGVGIPADEVQRLTERFFRASTATERRIPGVGLGLAISRAIVDAHGGTLSVDSVVGEGTTFVVRLPAAP